jgi:hypothetical protein
MPDQEYLTNEFIEITFEKTRVAIVAKWIVSPVIFTCSTFPCKYTKLPMLQGY